LDWRQQFVRGGERIAHQDSKRRRTIQEHEIECLIGVQRFECFRQAREMIWHPRDFDLRAGQIEIGGHDEQAITFCRKDSFDNRGVANQWLVQTSLLYSLQTKRTGGVCLRIEIDNQDPLARLRQRGAKIHRRCRLADATFLISDRDNFHSGERTRLACSFRRPRRNVRSTTLHPLTPKSSRWRGRHRQHASRVRSPESEIASSLIISNLSNDDVAGSHKRKLNFLNFRFGVSAVAV
jgi:hypothetical protein